MNFYKPRLMGQNFKFYLTLLLTCLCKLQASSGYDIALKELGVAYTDILTGRVCQSLSHFNNVLSFDADSNDEQYVIAIIGSFGKALAYDILGWRAQTENMLGYLEIWIEAFPEDEDFSFTKTSPSPSFSFFQNLTECFASDITKNHLMALINNLQPATINLSNTHLELKHPFTYLKASPISLRFCGVWSKCKKTLDKLGETLKILESIAVSAVTAYASIKTILIGLDYYEQKCAIELDHLRNHPLGSTS